MVKSKEETNGSTKMEMDKMKADYFTVKIPLSYKAMFIFGLFCGSFLIRHQVMLSLGDWLKTKVILGYEYNAEEDCVIMKKKNGKLDWCRPLVDCSTMCHNLTEIDVLSYDQIEPKLFKERYAYTGRPLLVRNATNWWPAVDTFTFDFFRDLYEDLNSPVLYNDDPDCQFFSWEFDEFSHLQQVFDMADDRWQMLRNYNPWYIGWANCDEDAGDILRDYYERPDFLPNESESGRRDWIFMGTPGFGAPYHVDNVKYPSWQAQVSGIKRWSLRPPPECWWSCPKEMNVTLYPGDVIVVNTNWWYHATSVLEGLSVTVTNEYM